MFVLKIDRNWCKNVQVDCYYCKTMRPAGQGGKSSTKGAAITIQSDKDASWPLQRGMRHAKSDSPELLSLTKPYIDDEMGGMAQPCPPWKLELEPLDCCLNAAYAMFCSTVGGRGGSGDIEDVSTRMVDAWGGFGAGGGETGRDEGTS